MGDHPNDKKSDIKDSQKVMIIVQNQRMLFGMVIFAQSNQITNIKKQFYHVINADEIWYFDYIQD